MTRPEILALCAACLPLMAMSDVDLQRNAAVDQMANACIADPTHPQHNSDLCRAFLYGTYYQARFQQSYLAPETTRQKGEQGSPGVPVRQVFRKAPALQSLEPDHAVRQQRLKLLEQQLRTTSPEGFIMDVPPQTFGTGPGQIVR